MKILRYDALRDADRLISLLKHEGDDWSCYHSDTAAPRYLNALKQSISYVTYEDDCLCGYVRALDDCGFYIYICDLLVMKEHRGNAIGKSLMEHLRAIFPNQNVYVMSGVDGYYHKLGYHKEGSIFELP